MSEVFLKVVNMSISAGWLVLTVLVLRLILKKAPKWVSVLLWGIVAIRLICPFSIESALSLIPSKETISPEIMMDWTPEISTGIGSLDRVVNPAISTSFAPKPWASANPLQILIPVAANLWLLGVIVLLAYTAISYLTLRLKLRTAIILRDNIFQCETVSSPFVLGILKPRIYLPYTMDGKNLHHVVAHEQAHIRRKDHWWKPLGFLLLTVYWFNPLMWLAYILLCRDIELACDEKVIAELGNEQRADYTQALVACAVNRSVIAACPLAFGEVGVKERVKSVMNYKKPAFWLILTALALCVAVAICFLTDPFEGSTVLLSGEYQITEMLYSHTLSYEENFVPSDRYSVTAEFGLCQKNPDGAWVYLGPMEKYPLTNEELYSYNLEGTHRRYPLRKITDAYILRVENDFFYLLFQTKGGKSYLAYGWEDVGERGQAGSDDTGLRRLYQLELTFNSAVTKWFDYTKDPSGMSYENELKIQLDEFPDITFKYTPYDIVATTSWEDSNTAGKTFLISGLPIWNAYFCDLTGDGMPEICSQVSYGSGMIDNRVIIIDYANGISYKLEDRGYHDYYLRMNDADGYLYVDQKVYNSDELVSSGRLVLKDDGIQIEPVFTELPEKPDQEISFTGNLNLGLNAEIVEIDSANQILYVKDIDDSAKVFGDRCAIVCNYAISRGELIYVNYEAPNDVRTIDFSAFEVGDAITIGMYESEMEKALNGSAIAEQIQLGTQKFADENLIKKISKDLNLPAGCSLSYIGEYSDGTDALLWFAIDGSYPDRYVAVGCEKLPSGKYKFIDSYSPMTYALDIVHVVWKAEDIFLVNNSACAKIVFMNQASEVIREIDTAEHGLPYIFRLSMPTNPGICMFVDADGEEIR